MVPQLLQKSFLPFLMRLMFKIKNHIMCYSTHHRFDSGLETPIFPSRISTNPQPLKLCVFTTSPLDHLPRQRPASQSSHFRKAVRLSVSLFLSSIQAKTARLLLPLQRLSCRSNRPASSKSTTALASFARSFAKGLLPLRVQTMVSRMAGRVRWQSLSKQATKSICTSTKVEPMVGTSRFNYTCDSCGGQQFIDGSTLLAHLCAAHNLNLGLGSSYEEESQKQTARRPVGEVHEITQAKVSSRRVQKIREKSQKRAKRQSKKAEIIEENVQSQ